MRPPREAALVALDVLLPAELPFLERRALAWLYLEAFRRKMRVTLGGRRETSVAVSSSHPGC